LKDRLIRSNHGIWTLGWLLVLAVNGLLDKAIALPIGGVGNGEWGVGEVGEVGGVGREITGASPATPHSPLPYRRSAGTSLPQLNDDPMAQVTSVSQLKDVQPTDWAFQALQALVERYGCIASASH